MNRMKFELKTRSQPMERPGKEVCGICKRQISRYTCPTCNLPYCSLTCFKSEVHSKCSETFYRKEIENDIHTAPSKSAEERHKMLELLRKFEEESAQETDEPSEDDEGDDLAQKLMGLNLEEANVGDVWAILSPSQRDTFLQAMRDPSSELAQQLLSSPELEQDRQKPWWESPAAGLSEPSDDHSAFGAVPRMMSIPQGLVTSAHSAGSTRPLMYNILALCLTYAYVTRRLSVSPLSILKPNDPDRAVAQDLISKSSPFLTEQKSTVVFESVDSLVIDIWSRLEALPDPPSHGSFALLLADAAHLFRPQRVSVITEGDLQSQPAKTALLVLSDVAELFAPTSAKSKRTLHKLAFYAAYLRSQPIDVLRLVADEARVAGLEMQSQLAV